MHGAPRSQGNVWCRSWSGCRIYIHFSGMLKYASFPRREGCKDTRFRRVSTDATLDTLDLAERDVIIDALNDHILKCETEVLIGMDICAGKQVPHPSVRRRA